MHVPRQAICRKNRAHRGNHPIHAPFAIALQQHHPFQESKELKTLRNKIMRMEAELDAAYEATAELVAEEQEIWKNEQIKNANLERQLEEVLSANNSAVNSPVRKAKARRGVGGEREDEDDGGENDEDGTSPEAHTWQQVQSPNPKSEGGTISSSTSCTDLSELLVGRDLKEVNEDTKKNMEEKLNVMGQENYELRAKYKQLEEELEFTRVKLSKAEDDKKRLKALKNVNMQLQESVEMLDKEKEKLIGELNDLRESSQRDMAAAQQRISDLEDEGRSKDGEASTSVTPGSDGPKSRSSSDVGVGLHEKKKQSSSLKKRSGKELNTSFINARKVFDVKSNDNDSIDTGSTDADLEEKSNSKLTTPGEGGVDSVGAESSSIDGDAGIIMNSPSSPPSRGALVFPTIGNDMTIISDEHESVAHVLSIRLK